jgi:putative ABC transport system permease protein
MIKDLKVGFFSARSSITRGNRKTSFFIIFVLGLIFMNLIFFPSLINGMMSIFVGMVQDYAYGNIVIEPAEDNAYINNADNVLKKVRSVNGVVGAAKRLSVGASIKHKEKVVGAIIDGLIPAQERDVSKYEDIVVDGEFLGELSRDEIMIGAMLVEGYFGAEIYDNLGDVKVGSLINVTYGNGVERTYKVKGIHEGTWEGTDEGEEAKIKEKIIAVGVKEKVFTWQEKAEALMRQALQSMGALGIMSKIVSLIVGAALIFIIIYINTLHRKKEIGILKAIGITPNSIRTSYVFISLFYTILGILFGLILFFAIAFYLQANPIVFYETMEISPVVEGGLLIQSILIMMVMSVIAGFIPAWLVTKQNILEAIWGR